MPAHVEYNKNITEQMYIDEMNQFCLTAFGNGEFPNTIMDDFRVLKLLYAGEESANTKKYQKVI